MYPATTLWDITFFAMFYYSYDIKKKALEEGMHTLRMSATEYVLDGITSLSEMIKVSFDE